MKIAYIVEGNPEDNRLWSGTVTAIYNALKKEHDVLPVDITYKSKLLSGYYRVKTKLTKLLTDKKFYSVFAKQKAIEQSKLVDKFLRSNKDIDLVFCPAKSGSIAYVKTDKKVVYLTDATFNLMVGYYDYLTNLSKSTLKSGNEIEFRAISRSNTVICASEWAKNSVVKDYAKDVSRVKVIPFGANLVDVYKDKETLLPKTLNLLFCGVEWERKGGDIALETLKSLRDSGFNAKLYLVGCKPPYDIKDENIIQVGFLNKNNPEELKKLFKIYSQVQFLILPTKAEAAGIVFAEASMNGIISLTYDTGGVGSYVVDGVNGYKLPLKNTGKDFANAVIEIFSDEQKFIYLKKSSRKYYEDRLNYQAWLKDFNKIL